MTINMHLTSPNFSSFKNSILCLHSLPNSTSLISVLLEHFQTISLIPSIFGGRRTNVFDPSSLNIWDPFDGFFTSALSNELNSARETSAFANTRIDWKETPEAHIFKSDLPGLKKEEVKVEVEEGRGKSSLDNGKFLRRFRLPKNVKMEEVKASMENEVLTVTVPKVEEKQPEVKSVEISG
ncbi:unnamed protein product [Ilex paraguariensis]|uniref:SHSP domain-containing protein n=1 Tax=Ilex paraguariensis TaxID=185542 RepID=A0ABC8U5M9_9AQUA